MQPYLTPKQVAETVERRLDRVQEMLADGSLFAVRLPGNGLAVPVSQVPRFIRVSEEEG